MRLFAQAMTDQSLSDKRFSDITALICLASGDEIEAAFANVLGRPLLYHQIKALSRAGISTVRIYVEHVPGILLSTLDALQASGHDVRAVRSVSELAGTMDRSNRLLVLQSDLWWDSNWLLGLLDRQKNTVFTLNEQAGNERFERIDLNARWTGIANCDAHILDDLGEMPEGWDLASLLLRRTQQLKIPAFNVAQSDLSAGLLQKFDVSAGTTSIENAVLRTFGDANNDMESLIAVPLLRRVRAWSDPSHWLYNIVNWTTPTAAILSAGLAAFALPTPALIVAMLAALFSPARWMLKRVSYQSENIDPVDVATGVALIIALYFCLDHAGESALDAGFLTLALAGLFSLVKLSNFSGFRFVSLLPIILGLLFGQIVGLIGIITKILVLAIVAFLLVRQFPRPKQP